MKVHNVIIASIFIVSLLSMGIVQNASAHSVTIYCNQWGPRVQCGTDVNHWIGDGKIQWQASGVCKGSKSGNAVTQSSAGFWTNGKGTCIINVYVTEKNGYTHSGGTTIKIK